ncbi:peptidoglycan DD-metalloendopeptidase family protein [Melaminivora sp.]
MLAAALVLAGCGTPVNRAPVEDRGTFAGNAARPESATVLPALPEAKPLPGAENAGKPGYYTVKPGDTLIRIGLEHGQSWKDIARWNNLENANLIEVGQVLRVQPPTTATVVAGVAGDTGVVTRPIAPQGGAAAGAGAPAKPSAPAAPEAPASNGSDAVSFIWPASGALIAGFDEARNKGLDLAGKAGDPVLAAADGRVVYAGAGLRGYGNLVILKHNNTYLTAYAHNQALLVKEDQTVRRGQKIAEMGSTDADRVKLHFEVRRQGKPVDPARYLPAR